MAEPSSAEKTEEPTPRRLAEARKRGEVPRSRDLTSAAVLVAVTLAVLLGAEGWFATMMAYMRSAIAAASSAEPAIGARRAFEAAIDGVLLPVGAAAAAALAVGVAQTRGLVAFQAISFDLSRVMPRRRRVLSADAGIELAKGFVKLALTTAVVWIVAEPFLPSVAGLTGASPWRSVRVFGIIAQRLFIALAITAAALGVADYLWQLRRHHAGLRMTRDEVRREHKESEGDPRHKAERARLHRAAAQQQMLEDVRKADFVVVNPDHIAVAVRYDREAHAAPVIVAKGERLLAEQIKAIAREAGVPIFRDVTLARSLRTVEEGDEIPEALYEAVAEILRTLEEVADRAPEKDATTPTGAPRETDGGTSFWRRV